MKRKARLTSIEAQKLRDGVNEEIAGYIKPAAVALEDIDYNTLPPRGPLDKDLLTASLVRTICEDMAMNHVSAAIAGRAVGLPEKLLAQYLEQGNEDLIEGRYTRLCWFAALINRAEGRVQRSLVGAIIANPLGWINCAHLMDHFWPESFAVQRMNFKAQKGSSLDDELKKQLEEAREGGSGAPLPYVIDVESVGTQVIDAE